MYITAAKSVVTIFQKNVLNIHIFTDTPGTARVYSRTYVRTYSLRLGGETLEFGSRFVVVTNENGRGNWANVVFKRAPTTLGENFRRIVKRRFSLGTGNNSTVPEKQTKYKRTIFPTSV